MSFQNQVKSWSLGDQLIAGGSVVLLVAMFLPWYAFSSPGFTFGTVTSPGSSISINGFNSWGWLTFLGLLALAGFWAVRTFAASVQLPAMPVKDGYIMLGLAAIEVAGALLFFAVAGGSNLSGLGYSAGISWGWFVAAIAIVASGAGAFLRREAVAPVGAMAGSYYGTPQPSGFQVPPATGYPAPPAAPRGPGDYTPPPAP